MNKSPEEIVQEVFDQSKKEIPAWEWGLYTPNEDQFREIAVKAVEADRAQR